MPAVVHIKTKIPAQRANSRMQSTNEFLRNYLGLEFREDYIPEQRASGSGVIISENGINSAIISPTGIYAGYSFAIPVNTVKKVVKEIIESGEVEKRS